MRGVIQPAHRAMIVHFKEGAKQFSLAAARATAAQPALQRGPYIAFFAGHLIPGPDLGRLAHGFHGFSLKRFAPFRFAGFGLAGLAVLSARAAARMGLALRVGLSFQLTTRLLAPASALKCAAFRQ